ncbi:MAG: hypothetical protein JNM13_11500 [Hyphomicrobiaceae bacterium]|nr:hypothetical protein [Hyphomicrobiaceae bacterium]
MDITPACADLTLSKRALFTNETGGRQPDNAASRRQKVENPDTVNARPDDMIA